MSSSLVTTEQDLFTDERVALIRRTLANDAPDLEFQMFIDAARHYGLDPVARQIYFIQRGGKWQWQSSIDGFRLIAERSKAYAGSDDYQYDTETEPHPNKATATVWKIVQGVRCPFVASARWSEYSVPNSPMWRKMPYQMLGKCAESAALRKAFPAELGGLYSREEMEQADPPQDDAGGYVSVTQDEAGQVMYGQPLGHDLPANSIANLIDARPVELITDQQRRDLHKAARDRGYEHDSIKALAITGYGVTSTNELTKKQAGDFILWWANPPEGKTDAYIEAAVQKAFAMLPKDEPQQATIEAMPEPDAPPNYDYLGQ